MSKGWIGVDLDGTLAEYHGWQGASHIGRPISPILQHVKNLLAMGWEVRIITARATNGRSATEAQEFAIAWRAWCKEHLDGKVLQVTACKDFRMIALFDDRAIAVETNTGRILGGSIPGVLGGA